jgi:hypothetical protein
MAALTKVASEINLSRRSLMDLLKLSVAGEREGLLIVVQVGRYEVIRAIDVPTLRVVGSTG